MTKNILLTGATGNVGTYIAEELTRRNIRYLTATHREPHSMDG